MQAVRGKKQRGRLTRSGWAFVIIIVPVLLSALNTGTNLLYLVVGGLGSFMLLSVVLSAWFLRGLALRREAPQAVHRGQPLSIYVYVENQKPFLSAISLRIERSDKRGVPLGYIVRLPARRAVETQVEITFDRRGVYPLPAFDLVTGFPFGLIERRQRFSDALDVIVYPRVRAVRASALERLYGARYTPRTAAADGNEFFSLREYVPGDDPRRVAWRVSARLGVWMIREMAHDNAKNVAVILDTRLPPRENAAEEFEAAIEAAASIAVTLLNRQYRVSVVTAEGDTTLAEGGGHAMRILKFLALAQPGDETASTKLQQRVQALTTQDVAMLMVSPSPEAWGDFIVNGAPPALNLEELIHV